MDKTKHKDLSAENPESISRRSFIKGAGLASIGAAMATGSGIMQDAYAETKSDDSDLVGLEGASCVFNINGKKLKTRVEPRTTLVEVLRDHFGLTGTKVGCDRGACGACTVIVDGRTLSSCMTLALDVVGKKIQTIEGVESGGKLDPLQRAFVEKDALQCGFCTPGMIMSCKNLLDGNPHPSLDEVKAAVSGNLCRCGSYPKIFEAVMAISGKGE